MNANAATWFCPAPVGGRNKIAAIRPKSPASQEYRFCRPLSTMPRRPAVVYQTPAPLARLRLCVRKNRQTARQRGRNECPKSFPGCSIISVSGFRLWGAAIAGASATARASHARVSTLAARASCASARRRSAAKGAPALCAAARNLAVTDAVSTATTICTRVGHAGSAGAT
jgi:hypothetical protein